MYHFLMSLLFLNYHLIFLDNYRFRSMIPMLFDPSKPDIAISTAPSTDAKSIEVRTQSQNSRKNTKSPVSTESNSEP